MKALENLVWIDCEMTGLDVEKDCLVEIAVVITDSELNILDEGITVVIKPREDSLSNMSEFVTNMHKDSGLFELLADGLELGDAENKVLDYIKQFAPEPRSAPLAGNSIGTDRMFLNRYMPTLDAHLHYRNVDVSSIKELTRRWYPKVYFQLPKKTGDHRALADIRESIAELAYYRKTVFVEAPGPSSDQAKDIASQRHSSSNPIE
jgi:oligoribonuclease